MAQIDMNKLKAGTANSDKVEELKASEQPKTGEQPAELINNASDKQESNSEISHETKATEAEKKIAVVRYIGSGVWKDAKGELWSNVDKTANIVSERKYPTDEYEEREDFKFMVGYGAMKVTFV